jgi:4,5-dihydroxyphthalate decarboxylase
MGTINLRTMLGDYPHTVPIKTGKVTSNIVKLDFTEAEVPHDHFKEVVRGEFDVAELAIMTYMQAKGWNRALVALPVAMNGRIQHGQICYNSKRGALAPKDIEGRKVGVRTYSQTTPTWVRGILQNDYGVDLSKVNWVTFTDGHVPEFKEPSNCTRAAAGKKMIDMLLNGELDAAVMAVGDYKDQGIKTLIPDPKKAADEWYQKHRALQLNHILVVKGSVAKEHPDAVREIYRMFVEGKKLGVPPTPAGELDTRPIGYAVNKPNFELAMKYAWQQRTIPRELKIDDLLDATTRTLGA